MYLKKKYYNFYLDHCQKEAVVMSIWEIDSKENNNCWNNSLLILANIAKKEV